MSEARAGNGPFLIGIDGGTEGLRAGVFDTDGRALAFAATPYGLSHPRPGWAEQDPDAWWSALVKSVRGATEKAGVRADDIAGISLDGTTCTVVALDDQGRHLRPAIMWMDVRASEQARAIGESSHPARKYNGGGKGPVSAEWYPSKALWLKQREPDTYERTRHLVEYTDWLNWRLTGGWTANINTASIRAYYDRGEDGWPRGFYDEIGLGEVLDKLPSEVVDLGEPVGELAEGPAQELGLRPGTPVAQGGADAFVAQIGLGVVQPGKMALITGSSHVLVGQSDHTTSGEGFFGAYTDAVVPGQYTVEGGQVSTGSVLKWFKDNFCADVVREAEGKGVDPYDLLNERSSKLPVGSDGLIVNEYWQGNRTPYTDPEARGIMWGLSLHHGPAHIYKAVQEGVCYGSEHILRHMRAAGVEVRELVAAGGATNSRTWMQMHADVTGVPIALTEVGEAPVLGCAILAAAGAGIYPSVREAAEAMVHETDVLEPDQERHDEYQFFVDAYAETYPRMRDLIQAVARKVGQSASASDDADR